MTTENKDQTCAQAEQIASTYLWLIECAKKTGITVHFRGDTMIVGHGYPEEKPASLLSDNVEWMELLNAFAADSSFENATKLTEFAGQARTAGPEEPKAKDANLNYLHSCIDAHTWTQEFCSLNKSADFGTMLAWFAGAIMAGFDEANRRNESARQDAKRYWHVSQLKYQEYLELIHGTGVCPYTLEEYKAKLDEITDASIARSGKRDPSYRTYEAGPINSAATEPKAQPQNERERVIAEFELFRDNYKHDGLVLEMAKMLKNSTENSERQPRQVSLEYFDEVVDALCEIGIKHHSKEIYRQLVIGVVKQIIKVGK